MINFILYEGDKKYRDLYISTILKIVGNRNLAYEIVEIDKYNDKTLSIINNLTGKKIFILEVDVVGMSGIDLARLIRKNGDWNSQIIMCTTHDKLENITLKSRLLILDYISKYIDCINNLKDSLLLALKILDNDLSLKFQYNGEIHQIPYQDILYIERDTNTDLSIINTKSGKVEINKSINEIEKILKHDRRFLKTHRSCIVNIDNISSFEMSSSSIRFNKERINLVTRDKKKKLKELLSKS